MKKSKLFPPGITFLIIVMLSGCFSGILIPKEETNYEQMSSPSAINGLYSNVSIDSAINQKESFWRHLKPFFKDRFYEIADHKNKELLIEVEVISEKRIQFKLLKGKDLLSIKTFRYDRVGRQLRIKDNSMFEGVPLLFYRQQVEVILLSLSKENNLIASYEGQASGGILFYMHGGSIRDKRIFERV